MNAQNEIAETPIYVSAIFRKDNSVSPISFWTPGDSEIRIEKIHEKQNASTFKTKGMGDRYKVEARGVISYLFRIGDLWYMGFPSYDMRIPGIHTRYTGAYFGGKKIIDERYDNIYKIPVDVGATFFTTGNVFPYSFWWQDGEKYEIDRVLGWERAASVRAEIVGTRYSIRVRNKETFLYRDDDLWFMETRDDEHENILDVHGRVLSTLER